MEYSRFLFLRLASAVILLSFAVTLISAKSKYYDGEDKPYEFGFNFEGNQHRREKKDENGIIMGEFGFITADGVYHVTVYATDENGNFKILSMKNIKLGPAPNKPPPNATPITQFTSKPTLEDRFLDEPQGDAPAAPQKPPPTPPPPPKQELTTAKVVAIAGCAHCKIPTTTPKPPPPPPPQPPKQPQQPQQRPPQAQQPQQRPPQGQQPNFPSKPSVDLAVPIDDNELPQGDQPLGGSAPGSPGSPGTPVSPGSPGQPFGLAPPRVPGPGRIPESPPGQAPGRGQGQGQAPGRPGQYDTPLLISGQVSTADPDAPNRPLQPGERPGLPSGITQGDMSDLLYRFNYTLGFHGHSERGYTNGAKVGEYYVNHRDGFADRISYVADENGYRPKIEKVRLSPEETPDPETEQNEEFGLRGYEFKWFYVPQYHYLNQ